MVDHSMDCRGDEFVRRMRIHMILFDDLDCAFEFLDLERYMFFFWGIRRSKEHENRKPGEPKRGACMRLKWKMHQMEKRKTARGSLELVHGGSVRVLCGIAQLLRAQVI